MSASAAVNWIDAEVIVAFGGTPRCWKRRPIVLPPPSESVWNVSAAVVLPGACVASSAPLLIVFADGTAATTAPSHSHSHRIAFLSFGVTT